MNFLSKHIFKISIALFLIVLSAIFLFQTSVTEKSVFVFDTIIDIKMYGKNSGDAAVEIVEELSSLDKKYSKYAVSSIVLEYNNLNPGEMMSVPDEMVSLLEKCYNYSELTCGNFDITTSALSDLWNVKSATAPPDAEEVEKLVSLVDYRKIAATNLLVKQDADIDFGGILKGYASDKIREIAEKYGIKKGIVNLGGNVCLIGAKSASKNWTIGITDPFSPGSIFLTVDAADENVITSGAYQRYFEYDGTIYHHILSPFTGMPADTDVASSTVISSDGALADALSTAIFVAGSEKGLEIAKSAGAKAIIIKKDGSVCATDNVKYEIRK